MGDIRQLSLFKGKRQKGEKPPPAPERAVHIAVCDVLRQGLSPGWYWFHIPNGEARSPETGALLQRMGVKPGVADLELISPTGRPHFLEIKRKGGHITDTQEMFKDEMAKRDVIYEVGRGFADCVNILSRWGAIHARIGA